MLKRFVLWSAAAVLLICAQPVDPAWAVVSETKISALDSQGTTMPIKQISITSLQKEPLATETPNQDQDSSDRGPVVVPVDLDAGQDGEEQEVLVTVVIADPDDPNKTYEHTSRQRIPVGGSVTFAHTVNRATGTVTAQARNPMTAMQVRQAGPALNYAGPLRLLLSAGLTGTYSTIDGTLSQTNTNTDIANSEENSESLSHYGADVGARIRFPYGWVYGGVQTQSNSSAQIVDTFFEGNAGDPPNGGIRLEDWGNRYYAGVGIDLARFGTSAGDLYFSPVFGGAWQSYEFLAFNDESVAGGNFESQTIDETEFNPFIGGELRFDLYKSTGLPVEVFGNLTYTWGNEFDINFSSETFNTISYSGSVDTGDEFTFVIGMLFDPFFWLYNNQQKHGTRQRTIIQYDFGPKSF